MCTQTADDLEFFDEKRIQESKKTSFLVDRQQFTRWCMRENALAKGNFSDDSCFHESEDEEEEEEEEDEEGEEGEEEEDGELTDGSDNEEEGQTTGSVFIFFSTIRS